MKKIINRHPLQSQIQAFARSPLGELKMPFKENQDKHLKKISRNRLHRQPTLPLINKPTSKSNQQNTELSNVSYWREASLQRIAPRNRSYMKTKTSHIQPSPVIINSQKGFKIGEEIEKMKKTIAGHQSRGKLVISRNCMSAEIKKDNHAKKDELPDNVKELRRVLHKKKSSLNLRSQVNQDTNIPVMLQAQRLAYQCKNAEETSSKQLFLEDFLNEWKQMNLS